MFDFAFGYEVGHRADRLFDRDAGINAVLII